MDRFFVPSLDSATDIFTLDDADEFRHLSKVLRLSVGDEAEFIDGRGALIRGQIERLNKASASIRIISRATHPMPPAPRITLICAIPKNAHFEDIIDKCTQLGVDKIVPVMTKRTEIVLRSSDAEAKCIRYRKIANVALKQSKRLWSPEILVPCRFSDALEAFSNQPDVFLAIPWLEGERRDLFGALSAAPAKKEIIVFIGPEGDFTPEEVHSAIRKGAVPVSLGPNVLRVDTAAIFSVSIALLMRPR